MEKKLRKIYFAILLVLALIASITAVIFAISFNKDLTPAGSGIYSLFNVAYFICLAFIFIAIIAAVAFAIYQLVKKLIEQPKDAKGSLIGIVAIIVVFVISYLFASPTDLPQEFLIKNNIADSGSKLVGAGVVMVYFLAAGVVLAVIYTEIAKKFK